MSARTMCRTSCILPWQCGHRAATVCSSCLTGETIPFKWHDLLNKTLRQINSDPGFLDHGACMAFHMSDLASDLRSAARLVGLAAIIACAPAAGAKAQQAGS